MRRLCRRLQTQWYRDQGLVPPRQAANEARIARATAEAAGAGGDDLMKFSDHEDAAAGEVDDDDDSLDLMSFHGSQPPQASAESGDDGPNQNAAAGDGIAQCEESDDWKWFEEYYRNHCSGGSGPTGLAPPPAHVIGPNSNDDFMEMKIEPDDENSLL